MRRLLLLGRLGFPKRKSRCRRQSRSRRKLKSYRERRRRDMSERLPLEHIVKYLSLRQRVQVLCVCKAWYHILRDSVVAEIEEMHKGPWLLMSQYTYATGWELTAYKNTGVLAQPCLLPSGHDAFGSHVGVTGGLLMGCMCVFVSDMDSPRLASSGGLMCGLLTATDAGPNVVVFNCLTGSAKTLPPPQHSDFLFAAHDLYNPSARIPCPCHVYMAVDDSDPMRYYIMLSRVHEYCEEFFSLSDRHMEVFDSKTGGWTVTTILGNFGWPVDAFSRHVWDGNFFFVYEDNFLIEDVYLAAYSVMQDEWSLQWLPKDISKLLEDYGALVIHKFEGRVFLAVQPSRQHGFQIWEVRQKTSSRAAMWVEIASTPLHISSDIENRNKCLRVGFDGELVAGGSCFYFITYVNGCSVREIPPLVFDIASDSWYFLPAKDWYSNYYAVLVHQPSLHAHV